MTQRQIKFFHSLARQKYRKANNAYLVEGNKCAEEWLHLSNEVLMLAATEDWLKNNQSLWHKKEGVEIIPVTEKELQKISTLKTAHSVVLAVEKKPELSMPNHVQGWSLFLDDIRTPGNMGTIIRIADWFGIQYLFHTPESVELFNPKVIQSTMGSLLRMKTVECTREELIAFSKTQKYPIYATSLEGQELLQEGNQNRPAGIIAMGNESKGLSELIQENADFKIKIKGRGGAESLNVAVATGIFCAWLTTGTI